MQAVKRNPWVQFAARRLVSLAAGILVLVVGSFLIVQLIPGDPVRHIAGTNASAHYVESVRHQLGLDQSVPEQFEHYVSDIARLNFGQSFSSGNSVGQLIAERFPKTLEVAGAALLIVVLVGIPLGLAMGGLTRGGRHPRVGGTFLMGASTLAAVPEFVLGTALVFLFAVKTNLLPVAGSDGLQSLVLPAVAVALPATAILARTVRVQTIDVLREDYIRTARSKRLSAPAIYLRHTLPNVLTAALTISGLVFMGLLGGTVVVENIFSWPGLGTAIVQAIKDRDYPVIQGTILILGVMVLVLNTLLDVVLAMLDPRSGMRDA